MDGGPTGPDYGVLQTCEINTEVQLSNLRYRPPRRPDSFCSLQVKRPFLSHGHWPLAMVYRLIKCPIIIICALIIILFYSYLCLLCEGHISNSIGDTIIWF